MKTATLAAVCLGYSAFCLPTAATAAPFQNGAFDSGGAGWTLIPSGGDSITGGNVHFNSSQISGAGIVYQSFDTVPGQRYTVRFSYGAWGGPSSGYTQQLQVEVRDGASYNSGTQTIETGTAAVAVANAGLAASQAGAIVTATDTNGDGVLGKISFTFAALSTTSTLVFSDKTGTAGQFTDSTVDAVELLPPDAIGITGSMHYTQNFDVLANTTNNGVATGTWADNSTIPGCWYYRAGTGTTIPGFAGTALAYRVGDGTVAHTVGNLYSMGAAASTDRALSLPSTGAAGEMSSVFLFKNTSPNLISLSNLKFNAEIRRANSTANNIESIFCWYRTAATQAEALTMTPAAVNTTVFPPTVAAGPNGNYITGWNRLTQADWTFSSPTGSAVLNTGASLDVTPAAAINLNPGEYLAIRWSNINDLGTDALMGIDDLDLTFLSGTLAVIATASNVTRDDNSTPRNPADDTISLDLTVQGSGAVSPTGWRVAAPAAVAGTLGTYGTPLHLTGIPIATFSGAGHSALFTVQDRVATTATSDVAAAAPWCTLTGATATGFTYLDGGTPADTSDDTVTIQVSVDGTFTGTTFQVQGRAGTAAYGTSLAIGPGTPGAVQNLVFADGADPTCTTTLKVTPPSCIGLVKLSGVTTPMVSEAVVGTVPTWSFDHPNQKMDIANGIAAAPPVAENLSEVIDLSTTSTVYFSAMLRVWDSSTSNFEVDDRIKVELILDGGTAGEQVVNLITPYDTGDGGPATLGTGLNGPPNGWINGYTGRASTDVVTGTIYTSNLQDYDAHPTRDEFNLSAQLGAVFLDNNLPLSFTIPASVATVQVRVSGVLSGTGVSEHASLSNVLLSSALEGHFVIGTQFYGGTAQELVAPVREPEWASDSAARTLVFANAGTTTDKVMSSEVIDLSGLGTVYFSGLLRARETSGSSNFETSDRLRAELVIDGTTVVNLISPYDSGDGTSGVGGTPNGPPNGYINGYEGTAGGGFATALLEYNNKRVRDEFNLPLLGGNVSLDTKFPLSYTIPAGANSVQLKIYAAGTDATESFTVSDVLFTTSSATTDTDADGVPDLVEFAQGTSPSDHDSAFTFTSATPHPSLPGVLNANFPTVTGRLYRGYYSTDMIHWIRDDGNASVLGNGSPAAWPLVPFGERRYLKVMVGREAADFPAALP